jgi:rhamnosyl/mannosyltransferase
VDGVRVTRAKTVFRAGAAPVCPDMVRVIRESPSDVIHLHWPNPTGLLAYMASGRRGPLVFTYHSDIVRQRILGPAFELVLRRALDACAGIVVSSPNYIASSAVLQGYASLCRVIPFGIDWKRLEHPPAADVERIRREHGPRIVLALGRMVYYKGFQYLIRAMAKIGARLLLVGDGPLRPELEAECRAHGVEDKVRFIGAAPDAAPYYHAADVFVLPSVARSEAFGLVQLEAMACGKPVVNTQIDSGVPYVSQDRVSGLTVPPADPDSLAAAVNLLLDNAELRARLGRAGRLRVRQEFSLDAMASRTLNLYDEAAGRPAVSAKAAGA